MAGGFHGFSEEALRFLADLRENNDKTWFDAHREDFDRHVVEPSRSFVTSLGERVKRVQPRIVADPRTNGSIFRIYRDTRFSRDKSPYKTHVGIFLWEGPGSKMENPGFYVHFEEEYFLAGEGLYIFPKDTLPAYREAVVREETGGKLASILHDVGEKGYDVGGRHYRRTPRGYDPAHPRADLLLFKGLHAGRGGPIPDQFFGPELLSYCEGIFLDLLPLHRWLLKLVTG
jgi:uncharacterized protein (TIGR02453 family)